MFNVDEHKNIVTFVDENQQEVEFEIIDILEIDDNEYAILLPIDQGEPAEEAIILKIDADENGDELLFEIEDDDEWEMVANVWQEILETDENNV